MIKKLCLFSCSLLFFFSHMVGQELVEKLRAAVKSLETDPQLRHGLLGFYVADAKTGKTIFARNEQVGLAPASTQKIITSACAYEMLGKNFRFNTCIRHTNSIRDGILTGDICIIGRGDPTLGSWRWTETTEQKVLERILTILQHKTLKEITGDIIIDDVSYTFQPLPEGWIWQDIGNYYGAGCWGFNWRENQYDLVLQSGNRIGDTTKIVRTNPLISGFTLANFIVAAQKGSGDNGYIYSSPFSETGFTTGTIPVGEKAFTISGSMPWPAFQFAKALEEKLKENNIVVGGSVNVQSRMWMKGAPVKISSVTEDSISSPTLDSMNYWFMRKSINLYGEAFLKALAFQPQLGPTSTEKGIEVLKKFWSERGIEKSALNILDGSGLSPQNRVTAHSLVKVLQFARQRSWYQSFYHSLPVYNGMKIKSGSIGGARSFAGYHTSSKGDQFIVAIIVNNYDGSSTDIVRKMYKVLDVLK